MKVSGIFGVVTCAALLTPQMATIAWADEGLDRFVRRWIAPETFCTNRLLPMEGIIADVSRDDGPNALRLFTDEVLSGKEPGIEGIGCRFENLKPVQSGVYAGTYRCGGESYSQAYVGYPPEGDVLLAVYEYDMEFEIRREGFVERWTVCPQ